MNIIVNGAKGHMGSLVCRLLREGFGGHSLAAETDGPGSFASCQVKADCVVDFSNHQALDELLSGCLERKLPAVIATTGHTEEERKKIERAAEQIPIFFAANMSIAIAWLVRLAQEAAAMFPKADIEIVECHHNRKLDVPSGTALALAGGVKKARPEATFTIGRHNPGKRSEEEIGIHSLRMGNVVGKHEVILSTAYETITLGHEAHDRALFAEGALTAASFLKGKASGLYGMEDLLTGGKEIGRI